METILLHYNDFEENYLYRLKNIVSSRCNLKITKVQPTCIMELVVIAKRHGITRIATTNNKLAQLLAEWNGKGSEKFPMHDYAGSIFNKFNCEFLILPALERLITVNYGAHHITRLFKKFTSPESFLAIPNFEEQWEIFDPAKMEEYITFLSGCTIIASDNETGAEDDRIITCNGFTGVMIISTPASKGDSRLYHFISRTVVVPFDSLFNIAFVKQVLNLPVPKVFQNGKYDIAYLLRYNIPVRNYAFDTINLFHSFYSELPKDLGFIPLYLLRDWIYHKHERKAASDYEKYRYNAKDCFSTAMSLMALLAEMPQWAIDNYKLEFPVVYPCILAEALGIKADLATLLVLQAQTEKVFTGELNKLGRMVNTPSFNPGSPLQVSKLFDVLGCKDIKGTGKIPIDKASARHPLNKRILKAITKYREDRKSYGTYCDPKKIWNGRWYYALNPHGTTTGRNASKESHFWCGLQIQNIPRDRKDIQIKSAFVADEGFYFGEADLEQAEARDTAYLSGDLNLIAAVDDVTKDYHGTNASAFFGVPYEKIVKSYPVIDQEGVILNWLHETLDKELRDLSKRTNHGANYNMGASVMLDTMGIEKVMQAKMLLKLPRSWTLLQVCEHLLSRFSERYSTVKGAWYSKVTNAVESTQMLVGPTGWTRFCFGHPAKNKQDLNSYVAHPPQSLNAMVLNKAFVKVFNDIWRNNMKDFRLHAQIHDSILFQYRVGREDLAFAVKAAMEIPITVTDTFGIKRTLLVPSALKGGATRWSELKAIARK